MNNILITGAAGFIGSQLSYKLYKNNNVILLDNMTYGKIDNLQFSDINLYDKLIIGDIRNKDLINFLLKKYNIDIIFHIAGIAPLPDCQSNPTEAVDVNINGSVNIFECARKNKVKKIVFASTNAMYENVTVFPTNESDLVYPTLIYPNTKFCAERFAQSFCDTYGMSITCVRFVNIYGPHIDCLRKHPPFVSYMIRELFYNRVPEFYSNGEQKRDYIYIDDLTDLLIKVSTKINGFDTVNCGSGKSYSVKEMYDIVQKIMGKNIQAHYNDSVNYWKKYPELYEGGFSISKDILDHEVNKFSMSTNDHAKNEYQWTPKYDIESGLKITCESIMNMLRRIHA